MTSHTHHIQISPNVLFQEIGGEAVLLDLNSEAYFGLDKIGTRIWQLIHATGSRQTTFDTLREEFDVSPEQLAHDLSDWLEKLSVAGLIVQTPFEK